MIAKVVTDLALDRTFDYKIPDEFSAQAAVGSRVRVPFGRTTKTGFIVQLAQTSDFPKLKKIKELVDPLPLIPPDLVKLGEWMAKYYCCSIEQAIKALLPGVIRGEKVRKKTMTFVRLLNPKKAESELPQLEEKFPKQALVVKKLLQRELTPLSTLLFELKITRSAVQTLEKKGLLEKEVIEVARNPFDEDQVLMTPDLDLTGEQAEALSEIQEAMNTGKSEVVLLEGVTGSGKTEVYLQAIRHCLAQGKEAIVLVPEIALTPQTVERFRSRFGDKVSVLHSGLSDGERFDEWMKIHEDQVQIAVGARSALFAPFRKLGLIIVDEEHEQTYKQEETPRYQARDVAVMRGHLEKVTVVLGSATPSFESKYNVTKGKYRHTALTKRVDDQIMPEIDIIDLKHENALQGHSSIFSNTLVREIYRVLDLGQQVILFLNRRGYATSLLCMNCGYTAHCEHCERPLTYHKQFKQLICHYCHDIHRAPDTCPKCHSDQIKFTGLGTERIENTARKIFPKARIARMDSDAMGSARDYERVLNDYRAGRVDILIGTQMIAKGLHFPNVTLVGILMADMGLHIPDFRAGERTLQLLTQVAGRAGRGTIPGRVLIQTYTPFHPALRSAARHDYQDFYQEEIETREMFGLPPEKHMIIIHFSGPDQSLIERVIGDFFKHLEPNLTGDDLLPPLPSPIERIDNRFRYQIGIRTTKIFRANHLLRQLVNHYGKHKDLRIVVDVDAYSML